ncbi:hypothetical protein TRFO_25759 [Tritrichomonas foetus]|uniref:Uncharacterized protein n=1 Tax=Tritrichomonas foetus TaxID=1144522 RepID=A0A1J4K440_9EUKA|nr:hypothetical protein TRFO_25759 [Tritrichomonas foetus]|eukprot:OHT06217.1 hypothetical protein TRFO_25759 [Tritrichomonas foetus]
MNFLENEGDIVWEAGEEIDPIDIKYNVQIPNPGNFNPNFRLISSLEITPEIINELRSGAPYKKCGTPEDKKYAQILSVSLSENFCDKTAAPDFIHAFETKISPNTFPEEHAVPLAQNSNVENEIIDEQK